MDEWQQTLIGKTVADKHGVGVITHVLLGPFDREVYYRVRDHDGHEQYWLASASEVND